MVNLAREIGRRVSLMDIVENYSKTKGNIQSSNLNQREQEVFRLENYTRTASRILFRMIGNLEAITGTALGYTAASVDPEKIPYCVLLGVGGVLMYLADYTFFDQINPSPTIKK